MEGTVLLCCIGLALGLPMAGLAFAAGARGRGPGRGYLGLVFLEASLYFLAEFVHAEGGMRVLSIALSYGSIFYGLPSLYFYARSVLGRSVERPLPHYLPALAAIPLGTRLAFYAAGRSDGGGVAAGAYILLALCGESLQLALYGRALLQLTSPRRGIVEGEWPRRTVLAGLCGYGSFLLLSWLGFGASILGELQGKWASPLPGLDLGSLVVAVLLAWTLGLCALWGGQGRSALSSGEMAGASDLDAAAAQLGACTTGSSVGEEIGEEGRGSLLGQGGLGEDAKCRQASGVKYGGRPLSEAEAMRIVGRARALLEASPDLGSRAVEPRRLAERLGMPYYLLSRAVNEAEGESLGDLVNEYRIGRAMGLLRERPELGILDVALESGFQAKSTFNEVFRKRVGSSPSEYRSRAGT